LDQYQSAVNQAEPEIRRAMESLKRHCTLDSKKVVESIIRKIGVREPFCQHGLMTHITNDDSTVRAILLSEVADLVAPNPLV